MVGRNTQTIAPGGQRLIPSRLGHAWDLRSGAFGLTRFGANLVGHWMKQPDKIGGAETQSTYLVTADADAIYARAKATGAKIGIEIRDEDYGGRGFSCRDLEGRLWNIGTYDPW